MNTERHPLYEEAKELVIKDGYCRGSQLQQHFKIGYNAAGRIMDELESAGVISEYTGNPVGYPRREILNKK